VVARTTADPAGAWSAHSLQELAQGMHTLTVTATDAAGNVSPVLGSRSFTVGTPSEEEPPGCGCASSPAGGTATLLGLMALWLWGRRRHSAWASWPRS
jgi:uncharacterized protein (TIGR03382 family)